jgi:putative SOS response-associated peptidase YedK
LERSVWKIFAGLAEVHHALEPDERDGFVIITAASDQGMVDIPDRKPLVLSTENAREWIDPRRFAPRHSPGGVAVLLRVSGGIPLASPLAT